ncbi:MOSC domain-containing protein [Haloglycomyces albus]|uniref:MOSC domain-containing protein n=1 Tax=Haloglycomyces albus TaxID=526067 RepID=UPI00046CF67B|nr:MOSC domain-containing protein [Haloglycomyces albus]
MNVTSVNIGTLHDNPWGTDFERTGIDKQPVTGPVPITDPGPYSDGTSGVDGDRIADAKSHGGRYNAVYAYAEEDYRYFETALGRSLRPGMFGENVTTSGIDVNDLLLGQSIRVGSTVLKAIHPRVPCATFRGWIDENGWLKTFTAALRPGTYFQVLQEGTIQAGDDIEILDQPQHDITIATLFRARLIDQHLLPDIAITPGIPAFVADYLAAKLKATGVPLPDVAT